MMAEKKKLTLKGRSKKTESDSETKKSTLSLKRRRKQVIVVDKKKSEPSDTAAAMPDRFVGNENAEPRPSLGQRRKRKVVVNPNSNRRKKIRKPPPKKAHVAKKKKAPQPPPKKKVLQKPLPKVKVGIVREPTPSQLLAKELNARLMAQFSVWREFKPLQLGVDEVVMSWIAENNWEYSKRVIQKAFRLHTRNLRYRKAISDGGQRYSLDGEPQGEVDDIAKAYANLKTERCDNRMTYDETEQALYAKAM